MMRNPVAWLVVGAALSPGLAHAHWQYTKWGMTPLQVQTAAKGNLSPAGSQDMCGACASAPLLTGGYSVGGQNFRVSFEFEAGKSLSGVVLATPSTRQTWGCSDLFDSLSQKYGAPVWHAPLTGDGTLPGTRWLDQRDDNVVFFNDASQQTGLCEIRYSPLVTGKGL